MRKFLISSLLVGLGCPASALAGTAPIYENFGTVNSPPQIDARAFFNAGRFDLGGGTEEGFGTGADGAGDVSLGGDVFIGGGGDIPFSTQNTLFYTNAFSGVMQADGFRFDFATPSERFPASVFVNRGRIGASTRLVVSATNIFNNGLMSVRSSGLIDVDGQNIDLSDGALRTASSGRLGFTEGFIFGTNYINGTGVEDRYWGVGTNGVLEGDGSPLDVTQLTLPGPPSSGPHEVITRGGVTNSVTVPGPGVLLSPEGGQGIGGTLGPAQVGPGPEPGPGPAPTNGIGNTNVIAGSQFKGFAYTNTIGTNRLVQAVLVNTNFANTNLSVQVRFAQPPDSTDPTRNAIVQYAARDIDVTTGEPVTNFVYVVDRAATMARTNITLLHNFNQPTRRPQNYEVMRTTPFEWGTAEPGNTPWTNSLIAGPEFPNTTVTNFYAGYGADLVRPSRGGSVGIGTGIGQAPDIPEADDPSNQGGRVEINADTLDLTRSRLRAEGLLSIKANTVKGMPRGVDAPNLDIDMKSSTGSLAISNMVSDSVQRLRGQVRAWTALFTNQMMIVSGGDDGNGGTNQQQQSSFQLQELRPSQGGDTNTNGNAATTNTVNVQYSVLIVDEDIETETDVSVRNLVLNNPTNITLTDNLDVTRRLELTSPSVHIKGTMETPDPSLGATNFIGTVELINEGQIGSAFNSPNVLSLGRDRTQPYERVINRGALNANAIRITTEEFENAGTIRASTGPVSVHADESVLEGGQIVSGGDIEFKGRSLEVRQTMMAATNGTLSLDIEGRLTDSGVQAGNVWRVQDGFHVRSNPENNGDLRGTDIHSIAANFKRVEHTWSGRDQGASHAGFANNLALGRLVLDGGRFSQFRFEGNATGNAIYVENLQFLNWATNVVDRPSDVLSLGPEIKIYFASSNVQAEQLDGMFDGRLVWLKDFLGPKSSTLVRLPTGEMQRMNLSVLRSLEIDTDGDGVPNGQDPDPVDPRILPLVDIAEETATISWIASPQTQFRVEYTEDLSSGEWQELTTAENASTGIRTLSVEDPMGGLTLRFYRVLPLNGE